MTDLNLEKFSPKKTELQELSVKYLRLEIKGVDDKVGYLAVDNARKELKRTRVVISKTGKDLRTEAVSFQKAVIQREKELIAIIEPVEVSLSEMQEKINIEKDKIKRAELLPARQEKLKEIGVKIEDDFILLMDDIKFDSFYNEKYTEYLEEKELKQKAEQEKIEAEKQRIEEQKRIEVAKKEAEKEATEKAIKDAELVAKQAKTDKNNAIAEEKRKAEKAKIEAEQKAETEKQAIIDEQKRKDDERIAKEKSDKEAEELKLKKEQEEKAKLEKRKKYQNWLIKNGYTEVTKNDYRIEQNENTFTMFKKIDNIIIK